MRNTGTTQVYMINYRLLYSLFGKKEKMKNVYSELAVEQLVDVTKEMW